MLKRIIVFVFFLSMLVVIAVAPMHANAAPQNAVKLQETVVVTVAVVTSAPPGSSGSAAGGMPMSTLIIFGLLVVLGLAVVIGGMALMRPRE